MNKRTQKAQLTKKKISEVALKLFNEKGFSNVTVDEIIEQSSSSKGAFYNHFKSKHDIFLAEFKNLDTIYVNELVPQIENITSYAEQLETFLYLQMEYIEDNLGWDVTRTIYEHELNPERESFFLIPDRPLYQIIHRICEQGLKEQEFTVDLSAEEIVLVVVRAMRGVLYDWSINKGAYSLKHEHEKIFAVLLRGLI